MKTPRQQLHIHQKKQIRIAESENSAGMSLMVIALRGGSMDDVLKAAGFNGQLDVPKFDRRSLEGRGPW